MKYEVKETENEARRIIKFENGKEYKIRRLSLALLTKIGLNPDLTNSQVFKDLLSKGIKKDDRVSVRIEELFKLIPKYYEADDQVVAYGVIEPKLELEEIKNIEVLNDVPADEKKILSDEIRKLSGMGKEDIGNLLPFFKTKDSLNSSITSQEDMEKAQPK